jgi:hypothetical protein
MQSKKLTREHLLQKTDAITGKLYKSRRHTKHRYLKRFYRGKRMKSDQ